VVERGPEKAGVGGSIPSLATTSSFYPVPRDSKPLSLTHIIPYFAVLFVSRRAREFFDSPRVMGQHWGQVNIFQKGMRAANNWRRVLIREFAAKPNEQRAPTALQTVLKWSLANGSKYTVIRYQSAIGPRVARPLRLRLHSRFNSRSEARAPEWRSG
jgi:hypothetical protein